MHPNEFLKSCKLSNLNIPRLLAELKEDHLAFKISGFADTLAKRQAQNNAATMSENIAAKQNAARSTDAGATDGAQVCVLVHAAHVFDT